MLGHSPRGICFILPLSSAKYQKLQYLKKGGKSFNDYISVNNHLLEGLSVAGKKMEDSDLVLLVIAGLGDEYEALIQNVTSKREDDIQETESNVHEC